MKKKKTTKISLLLHSAKISKRFKKQKIKNNKCDTQNKIPKKVFPAPYQKPT